MRRVSSQIFLLQIILGTSKGLNLRNIAWHGFIEAVDVRYVTFLFSVIVSYGKLLKSKTIFPRTRPEISLKVPFEVESSSFNGFLTSPSIQKSNSTAWSTILNLQKTGNSKSAIFLLLTQTESLLRFIYGQVNQVDVTAHLDKYYIIMDSIFYEFILNGDSTPLAIGKINKAQELEIRKSNQRNRMLVTFPPQLMLLGYDIFHAADGPRIRDKMSHGEVFCDVHSKDIVEKLLQFIFHVVRFHDEGKIPSFEYESVFMTGFKVARKFNEMKEKVGKVFEALKIPEVLKSEKSFGLEKDLIKIDVRKVKGFFRPFDENQIMKLLLSVLENTEKALKNFSFSCDELFDSFNARKLSSTRRETLKQIVKNLPNFLDGFLGILKLVEDIFCDVQQVESDEKSFDDVIKLLKLSLKFTENLVKHFFHATRNFHLANEKICDFLQLIESKKLNK